jgi:hypothetical protein
MIDSKPSLENSIVNLEAKQFLYSHITPNMSVITSHQSQASYSQSNPKTTHRNPNRELTQIRLHIVEAPKTPNPTTTSLL